MATAKIMTPDRHGTWHERLITHTESSLYFHRIGTTVIILVSQKNFGHLATGDEYDIVCFGIKCVAAKAYLATSYIKCIQTITPSEATLRYNGGS